MSYKCRRCGKVASFKEDLKCSQCAESSSGSDDYSPLQSFEISNVSDTESSNGSYSGGGGDFGGDGSSGSWD